MDDRVHDDLWRIINDQVEGIEYEDAEYVAEQWICEISFEEMDVCF